MADDTMIDECNLVWLDLEMSGLNPDSDRILEIATLVTNQNLDVLAEGPVIAINQANELIDGMDDWNTHHHTRSGLIERVCNSQYNEILASEETLKFLSNWVPSQTSPMCGNTICQDRRFMARYMPELEKFFHYRNLDVSSIKILAERWRPDIAAGILKASSHEALADVRESVAELKFYRQNFLQDFKST